jgi:imidazolonepropionase-like amidohydrolase
MSKIILAIIVACCVFRPTSPPAPVRPKRIVIAVSTLLDGKGQVLKNTRIVIEGSKIFRIDPKAGPVDYDLRGLTVMPGWIDAHVHITWSFDKDIGRARLFALAQQNLRRSENTRTWKFTLVD